MGCELLPTKPPKSGPAVADEDVAEIVAEVEYLADTRAAGFRLKPKQLEPLHYELLILWARYREMIQQQNEQTLFLMAMTAKG